MLQRFCDLLFGWKVEPSTPVVAEPVASARPTHPEARLLHLVGSSFEQLERDAETRALHGLPPGVLREVRNIAGDVIDLQPVRYSSLAEAGVDARIEALDGPEAAEARRLQPLARRWVLRRVLAALKATA